MDKEYNGIIPKMKAKFKKLQPGYPNVVLINRLQLIDKLLEHYLSTINKSIAIKKYSFVCFYRVFLDSIQGQTGKETILQPGTRKNCLPSYPPGSLFDLFWHKTDIDPFLHRHNGLDLNQEESKLI